MGLASADAFNDNLRRIRDTIALHLARAGRKAGEVELMAVTKSFPRRAADMALEAGLRLLGENRVQEAEGKFGEQPLPAPIDLHLIGHLQTNKAKKAAALFGCVQSIDKFETAAELDRHARALGKKIRVLLELNTSGEASKSGYPDRAALLADLEKIRGLTGLEAAGLMTVGPLGGDERSVRGAFALLRSVFDEIRSRPGAGGFTVLSMGMSLDFGWAVEEGATLVRIGTALFGERSN
jgi:pyridoxal phosphate enzyme (YggS family)